MTIRVLPISVGVWLLLSPGAFGAEKQPETLKQAILRAIDLSAGQHVFGQGGKGGAKGLRTYYDRVVIHGSMLANDSMRVAFSRRPRRETENTSEAFSVEFSASGVRPRPVQTAPVDPRLVPENERKICNAVRTVMAKCLDDKKTDVSLRVSVTREKQETIVMVTFSLMVGHHRLFILNENNEITHESAGY